MFFLLIGFSVKAFDLVSFAVLCARSLRSLREINYARIDASRSIPASVGFYFLLFAFYFLFTLQIVSDDDPGVYKQDHSIE